MGKSHHTAGKGLQRMQRGDTAPCLQAAATQAELCLPWDARLSQRGERATCLWQDHWKNLPETAHLCCISPPVSLKLRDQHPQACTRWLRQQPNVQGDELPKRLLYFCGEMAAGRGCPGWATSPGASLQGFGGKSPSPVLLLCSQSQSHACPMQPKAPGLTSVCQRCHPSPLCPHSLAGGSSSQPWLVPGTAPAQPPTLYPSFFPSASGLLCWHFSPGTLDFVATLSSVMSGLYFKSLFMIFKKKHANSKENITNIPQKPPQEPCASSTQSSSRCIHRIPELLKKYLQDHRVQSNTTLPTQPRCEVPHLLIFSRASVPGALDSSNPLEPYPKPSSSENKGEGGCFLQTQLSNKL